MKKALMMAGWIGLAAASGFSASQYPPALLGGWKTTVTVKGNPVETTIFLRAGGACVCRLAAGGKTVDAEGTWTVSGKRLRVDVSGQTILDATFEVKGDTLILDGGANRCVRVADTTAAEKPMAAPEAGKTGGDLRLPEVKLRPNVICGYVVDAQARPISEGVGKIRVHAWTRGLHGEVHGQARPIVEKQTAEPPRPEGLDDQTHRQPTSGRSINRSATTAGASRSSARPVGDRTALAEHGLPVGARRRDPAPDPTDEHFVDLERRIAACGGPTPLAYRRAGSLSCPIPHLEW